jgi:CheY-like chemotaxis protein
VSRIARGHIELRRERADLAVPIQAALEAARPMLHSAGHRLTVVLPPETVLLDADVTRLTQVVLNLLNNAAKYTPAGGRVWLTAEQTAVDEVCISVRDTGVGIAPEDLPRLFQMFSQVEPALERSQGGLGIGLALVRGLVELHGGRVEARSDGRGRGSEFRVRLPAVAGLRPTPAMDEEDALQTPRRVLVADDNRDAAESLADLLRLMGHEVHTAHDGAEAVQLASSVRPDAVLLDIGMPKMNGYEAARCIRREPWAAGTCLVAITGWGQDEDRRKALDAGFDQHLTKPVEPAVLKRVLSQLRNAPGVVRGTS